MLLSLLSKRTLRADFRDAYGFTVRPQYLDTFKEFDAIYKKEEEERSSKWEIFLEQNAEYSHLNSSVEESVTESNAEITDNKTVPTSESGDTNTTHDQNQTENVPADNVPAENVSEKAAPEAPKTPKPKKPAVRNWADVRSSINTIENILSHRLKTEAIDPNSSAKKPLESIQETEQTNEESNEELTDNEQPKAYPFEELESLVRGGVPRDLRGEVWQAFVGVKARRVEEYYQNLLDEEEGENAIVPEKCIKQIEKDLPRTFPGHPALNEEGRDSLRRLLLAYARHNPSVGYCQGKRMRFSVTRGGRVFLTQMYAAYPSIPMTVSEPFAWPPPRYLPREVRRTLVGMMDDYFDGYFTTDMIESQVDQLVFEDLMRERYPNLVNHFDLMGVEMGWICGPWFLSIFVNMIPWESVLRVWDVILFEGHRAMLLRTGLALMELYGPALGTTLDAGDAITLLQSLVGSTFDSSNLVVTACVSFTNVTDDTLKTMRKKHRPDVIAAVEERTKAEHLRKSSKGLATKLYSFKREREPVVRQLSLKKGFGDKDADKSALDLMSPLKLDGPLNIEPINEKVDSLPDIQDQVMWLKAQLCSMLEDKRSATVRAEELETALMEMAQQDNRRELHARVEYMEQEVIELQQLLSDKKEQEKAMLEVLMRVEQEQKITEDARTFAERDAAAQRYLVGVLEEKYETAMTSLAQMEKRAVMAESTLEATLQYNSSQVKAQTTPPPANLRAESVKDNNNNNTKKPGLLSFGLGWRDRNKGKQSNAETSDHETSGYQEPEK